MAIPTRLSGTPTAVYEIANSASENDRVRHLLRPRRRPALKRPLGRAGRPVACYSTDDNVALASVPPVRNAATSPAAAATAAKT
jgi:hypothetical protein